MKKRFVSLLLAISMVLTFLPVSAITAFADSSYVFTSDEIQYTVTNFNEGGVGEVKVSGYKGSLSGEVTIQSTVTDNGKSYTVTSIGNRAFEDAGLTSITIPATVTSIGESAFIGCSQLTSVTIPDGVISIGDYAFGATGLTGITIPASVTSIGEAAFAGCEENTKFIVDSGNSTFFSDQNGVLYENTTEGKTLRFYPLAKTDTEFEIPKGVTSIGECAFGWCTKLTSITIPDSVTSIGERAFYECSNLTGVTIPGSVTSMGEHAFSECSNLTDVTILNGVTSIGGAAFSDCTSLTSITIPDSVTSIGDNAFSECTNLRSITIPDSVESIGSEAFSKCTGLTGITIPGSVTSIGYMAFNECSNLTDVTILNGVTSIGDYAFSHCTKLTSITIPSSVTTIGSSAFGTYYGDIYYTGTPTQWNSLKNSFGGYPEVKYLRILNLNKPSDVVVKNGNTAVNDPVRFEFKESELAAGKDVTLTVDNPDTDKYTYKWTVDGKESTGTSCTVNVKDSDVAVTLTRIQKLTKDDLTINIPNGEYDGNEKKVTVSDKDGKDVSCNVTYTKKGEITGSTDAPKDAGTYKVTITIKGGEHDGETIDAGTLTIKPATADTNDFEVTLPSGEADGTEKLATVTVPDGSIFKSDDVTIKKSYQVKDGDTWKDVEAPVSAGDYKLIVSVVSNDKNISSTDDTPLEWTFTIKEKSAPTTPEDPNKGNDKPSTEPEKPSTEPEKPAPKPEEKPEQKMKITGSSNSVKMKVNGEDVTPDEDGNITIREGDEVTITFDKSTLSDAQVFDQWVITPASVLNEVDPTAETITFTMPAEAVTIEAMTRDASIDPVTAQILGTSSAIVVGGASAAVLGYTGYMIGTELYLNVVLPDGAAIPQNYGELAKLVWNDAGKPAPAAVLAADATDEQKAMTWTVENQLISADKAADASVGRWEVIQTWNKAQEMKH